MSFHVRGSPFPQMLNSALLRTSIDYFRQLVLLYDAISQKFPSHVARVSTPNLSLDLLSSAGFGKVTDMSVNTFEWQQ